MKKKRKNYTPEQKVAILKKHLVDKVPLSDLCDVYDLHPTVFYRWQKMFFENGAAAFIKSKDKGNAGGNTPTRAHITLKENCTYRDRKRSFR